MIPLILLIPQMNRGEIIVPRTVYKIERKGKNSLPLHCSLSVVAAVLRNTTHLYLGWNGAEWKEQFGHRKKKFVTSNGRVLQGADTNRFVGESHSFSFVVVSLPR